jgi:hypothetical protein
MKGGGYSGTECYHVKYIGKISKAKQGTLPGPPPSRERRWIASQGRPEERWDDGINSNKKLTLEIVEAPVDAFATIGAMARAAVSPDGLRTTSVSLVGIPLGPAALAESIKSNSSEKAIRAMRIIPRISSQIIWKTFFFFRNYLGACFGMRRN